MVIDRACSKSYIALLPEAEREQVKKAVGKTGLMGNVLNQFGELDIQEVLKDMWTHDTKDLERTYFIRTLQGISQQKGLRMTFLSGGTFSL